MRRVGAILAVTVLVAVLCANPQQVGSQTNTQPSEFLPRSLDSLYPPVAPAPLYLIKMHEMARPMSALGSDAMEGDAANAKMGYAEFRQKYAEVSSLIPEWTDRFPMEPVDQLGAALESGNIEMLGPALGRVGQVCTDCHVAFMPAAYFRYHWGDFGSILISDPISGRGMSYAQLMMALEVDMTGVGADVQQGQFDLAHRHAKDFRARFEALKESCAVCHDSERAYYVDGDVFGMIDDLDAALAADTPQPESVGMAIQRIGQESCAKCHWVHIPAAYSRSAP